MLNIYEPMLFVGIGEADGGPRAGKWVARRICGPTGRDSSSDTRATFPTSRSSSPRRFSLSTLTSTKTNSLA